MNKLIELLLREPFLAVVAIGAILQVLGKVLGAIGKRGPATGSRPPTAPPGGARTQAARPTARPSARQPSGAAGQTRMQPTQAEIAAEMRRILGLEQKAPERAPPQPPPLRRESGGERPPEPLRTQTFGGLNTPYESHIGDGLGKRRAPASSVGASKLGTLGGRSSGRMRRGRGGAHLVDLSNLPRAIVLREILDKPLGLRDLE